MAGSHPCYLCNVAGMWKAEGGGGGGGGGGGEGGRTRSRVTCTRLFLIQQFLHCAKSIENRPTTFLKNRGSEKSDI